MKRYLKHRSRQWFGLAGCFCLLFGLAPQTGADDTKAGKEVFDTYSTGVGMAYPAAGAMFKVVGEFLELTGYFGSSPDLVAEAIKRINQRLDALETRMNALEGKVQQVQNEVFRNENLARIRLLRAHRNDLKKVLVRLAQRPTDKDTKVALAFDAQVIAEDFLVDKDLWQWNDLALKTHTWQGKKVEAGTMLAADFKPWPAMEDYTLALVT